MTPERPEHWKAFGPEWFARNQPWLLFALNTPGLGRLVRRALRINLADMWLPRGTRIAAIAPNHYTVQLPDGSLRSDFRTHWKYAKRVYYAWATLWWLMHTWDSLWADRWAPALSFGFATLTVYPDANPESVTVDGNVGRQAVNETWGTIRIGAGNVRDDTSTDSYLLRIVASATTNQFAELWRAIFLFDTSALTAPASISAAVMSLRGTLKADALSTTPDVDIYTSTPGSNTGLANSDYAQIGTTSQTGSAKTYASFSDAAYNDFTFDATGRGNVSKTGVSKFGARNANRDVANSAPSWVSGQTSQLWCYYADRTGTTEDPKLVVTYTIPGGGGSAPSGMRGLSIFRSRGRRYWAGWEPDRSGRLLPRA